MGLLGRERSLTISIFSLLDTMHQREGQTEKQIHGQTPGDSKDLATALTHSVAL